MALLTDAMLHIGNNSKLIISVLVPVLMLHGLHFLYVAMTCRSYAPLVSQIRMFILSVSIVYCTLLTTALLTC